MLKNALIQSGTNVFSISCVGLFQRPTGSNSDSGTKFCRVEYAGKVTPVSNSPSLKGLVKEAYYLPGRSEE